MFSESTASSMAFTAFPGNTLSPTPTPPSHCSANSFNLPLGNPLAELIETEKSYMETLKIIDNQIKPLWTRIALPHASLDFSELFNSIHQILKVNDQFYMKLTKVSGSPQTIKELGNVLLQWIEDMDVPYKNFFRNFDNNLRQCSDIADRPEIQRILDNLSTGVSYTITLESLLNAPVQQLQYYQLLYSRLADSAAPGNADYELLSRAIQRIDAILLMAQKNNAHGPSSNTMPDQKALPPINTDRTGFQQEQKDTGTSSDLVALGRQLDCSQVVDAFTGAVLRYTFQPSATESILLRNSFVLFSDEDISSTPLHVHLILTVNLLIITQENAPPNNPTQITTYKLLHPPFNVSDITVKAKSIDRELVGEYFVEFNIADKKLFTMRTSSKDIRNTWIGTDSSDSSIDVLTPCSLTKVVHCQIDAKAAKSSTRKTMTKSIVRRYDLFSYYGEDSNEISPISSDDSDFEDDSLPLPSKSTAATPMSDDVIVKSTEKSLPQLPQMQRSFSATAVPEKEPSVPNPPIKQSTSLVPGTMGASSGCQQPSLPAAHGQAVKSQWPAAQGTAGPPHGGHKPQPQPGNLMLLQPLFVGEEKDSKNGAGALARLAPIGPSPTPHTGQHPSVQKAPPHPSSSSPSSFSQPAMQRPPVQPYNASQQRSMHPNPYPPSHHNSGPAYRPGPLPPKGPVHNSRSGPVPRHSNSGPMAPASGAMPGPRPSNSGHVPNGSIRKGLPPPAFSQQELARNPAPFLSVSSRTTEDTSSPPRSPTPQMLNGQPNGIRQVIYNSNQCEVFHWKSESWYAVEGQCVLQVRQTFNSRSCVAIQLQTTGQLYLNAWISQSTVVSQPLPTDVNLSVTMGNKKENYLIHFPQPPQALALYQILCRTIQEAFQNGDVPRASSPLPPVPVLRSDTLYDHDDVPEERNVVVPQTLRIVMQCRCKLFVQNEHSNWSSFGTVAMKVSQQIPSQKMHIEMEGGKGTKTTKLVSATVQSRNVERIGAKRITLLLTNEQERTSIVYMLQVKEEMTSQKIYEYLRTKNAENGW